MAKASLRWIALACGSPATGSSWSLGRCSGLREAIQRAGLELPSAEPAAEAELVLGASRACRARAASATYCRRSFVAILELVAAAAGSAAPSGDASPAT